MKNKKQSRVIHIKIVLLVAVLLIGLFFVLGGNELYAPESNDGLDDFITLTREDPLFYSPFFEYEAFSEAVEELKRSEEKLKQTALHNISLSKENYVESYTALIQDTPLFPIDFLALLPDISHKTEKFMEQPTAQKARRLLSLYEDAQQAYEKDAKSMTEAFTTIEAHIPSNRPVYYFFINSATSVRLAQNNFELIYKNSVALKEEIDRRHDCLSGKKSCDIARRDTSNILDLEKPVTPVMSTGANIDFIRTTLPFASSTREIRGPYNTTSRCWGFSDSQPMYALYSTNEKGERMILPKLSQENYYNLLAPQATDAISEKIRSMGLQFYAQAEGTTYECSDLSFYPEILAMDFIHEHRSASSASTTGSEDSESEKSEDLKYVQLLNNKFGLLDPALQSLASFTNLLETSQRISTDFVLSPQFLFTTRSAYSLTYLPFARSVWRLEEQPKFLLSPEEFHTLGAPQQFKTLTELKQEGYSEDEIKKSHINQKEFIEGSVE